MTHLPVTPVLLWHDLDEAFEGCHPQRVYSGVLGHAQRAVMAWLACFAGFNERQLQRASDSVITWQRSVLGVVWWRQEQWPEGWGVDRQFVCSGPNKTLIRFVRRYYKVLVLLRPNNLPLSIFERKSTFWGGIIPLFDSQQYRHDRKWSKSEMWTDMHQRSLAGHNHGRSGP